MIDPLLKAIIEDLGEDDSLRLRYAEQISQRDPERAEFIRLQCRLDKLKTTDPDWQPLWQRMIALLHRHRREWTRDVEAAIPASESSHSDFVFRRGFVEGVRCSRQFFALHAARILQVAPIRYLGLEKSADSLTVIANCPELAKIAHLYVGWTKIEYLTQLVASPYMTSISRLAMNGQLGNAGTALITSAPWACQLRRLFLKDSWIRDDGMTTLANCPHFGKLEVLNLTGNFIGDAGAAGLVASADLQSLRELYLDRYSLQMFVLESGPLNPISPTWQQAIRGRFPGAHCSFSDNVNFELVIGKYF